MMSNLIQLTKKLSDYLDILKLKFEQEGRPSNDREFFQFVKSETMPYFETLEKWEDSALQVIQDKKFSLYPQQIASTKENYETLIMDSYYKDTRKRNYMETNKSCHYIFNQLLKELQDEG